MSNDHKDPWGDQGGTPRYNQGFKESTEAKVNLAVTHTVIQGDKVFTPLVLGQVKVAATTLTDLYTVPAGAACDVTNLTICNQGAATTFRLAIRPAGAAINTKHYLYYDVAIGANTSVTLDASGIKLAATDVLSVYATLATVSFSAFGTQETARV